MDWRTWHEDYTDPDSALGRRLAVVQAQVRAALDRSAPGSVRAIRHPHDLTPYIRETFERAGFGELAFEDSPPFGVGASRLLAPPLPFTSGVRLFEFIGYDVLHPDFHARMT